MAKYAFLNFPTFGQVNPTLAIAQELVARGEEVVYFNTERLRRQIEATGARFYAYAARPFGVPRSRAMNADEDNQRIAMLPARMLEMSREAVPPLLEQVRREQPDCLIYSGLFVWARIIAHALHIPGVALWPTYAPSMRQPTYPRDGRTGLYTPEMRRLLHEELNFLRDIYHIPFADVASLIRGEEGLVLVFLPRIFQPNGDAYAERFCFVGPSFHPDRDARHPLSVAQLGASPRLYISLGTLYNNRPEFYQVCFEAFRDTDWHVILACGSQRDPASLQDIPQNFAVAPDVPQLEVLARTDVFITHGGMNSTMECLYFGVPMIVIPHTHEQQMTAERIAALGLGITRDATSVTPDALREAVTWLTHSTSLQERAQVMRQHIVEAGGYRRATDALQAHIRAEPTSHEYHVTR